MKIAYASDVITPEEVLKFLSLTGQSQSLFFEVIKNKELMKKAKELNVEISDEELQKFADQFRADQGLFDTNETLRFLSQNGLTEDDFEEFCERMIVASAVKEQLAGEKKVQEYFFHHQREFDKAKVSILRVNDESLANELIVQVADEGEDFHKLARIHSVEEATKYAGGYAGEVFRSQLHQDAAARIFSAKVGDIIGPLKSQNQYELILVEELKRAELTEEMKAIIKDMILEEWAYQFLADGLRIIP